MPSIIPGPIVAEKFLGNFPKRRMKTRKFPWTDKPGNYHQASYSNYRLSVSLHRESISPIINVPNEPRNSSLMTQVMGRLPLIFARWTTFLLVITPACITATPLLHRREIYRYTASRANSSFLHPPTGCLRVNRPESRAGNCFGRSSRKHRANVAARIVPGCFTGDALWYNKLKEPGTRRSNACRVT